MKKIRKLIACVLTAVFLVSAGIVLLEVNAPPENVDATSVDDGSTVLSKDGTTFAAASLDDGFNSSVLSEDGSTLFEVERLKWSGRSDSESIVMVLMGDGFLASQQGSWPNPAAGTFLHQAKIAIDYMMSLHPFDLFADIFTVYAVKVVSVQSGIRADRYESGQNYFRSYHSGNGLHLGADAPSEARRLAGLVANGIENVNMIQVIANATAAGGSASITRTDTTIGVAISGMGTGALKVFVHEFGHTFGFLADECKTEYNFTTADAPNRDIGTADKTNIKWKHWLGHGNNTVRRGSEEVERPEIGIYAPTTSQTGDPNSAGRLKIPVNGTCMMT